MAVAVRLGRTAVLAIVSVLVGRKVAEGIVVQVGRWVPVLVGAGLGVFDGVNEWIGVTVGTGVSNCARA